MRKNQGSVAVGEAGLEGWAPCGEQEVLGGGVESREGAERALRAGRHAQQARERLAGGAHDLPRTGMSADRLAAALGRPSGRPPS